MPLLSISEWQHVHEKIYDAKNGDFVIYTSYTDKLRILTSNATTPYVFAFFNLAVTGSMVCELQSGPNAIRIPISGIEASPTSAPWDRIRTIDLWI